MPVYRGIVVTLHSQFNIDIFPEYPARPQEYYTERGFTGKAPELYDDATSTCNVFVPVLPGSQFWIAYGVRPPVPADQQFLFKLFINGVHIVSWTTGKEDDWKGKTMFALYERDDGNGHKRVEKRVLCFTPPDNEYGREWTDVTDAFDETAVLEIRVFRALGKKRVERHLEQFSDSVYAQQIRGINLVNAGQTDIKDPKGATIPKHPKRFYKVALIDPTDRPFATFRYYYRTWDQLRDLGMLETEAESEFEGSGLSIIEPDSTENELGNHGDAGEAETPRPSQAVYGTDSFSDLLELYPYETTESPVRQAPNRLSYEATPPRFRRQTSIAPTEWDGTYRSPRRRLISMASKESILEETDYKPLPAYPVNEWAERTPSPIRSMREGLSTPPLTPRKGFTATGIISAIADTWRRRTVSSEGLGESGSRSTSRTASRNASRSASRNASRNASR